MSRSKRRPRPSPWQRSGPSSIPETPESPNLLHMTPVRVAEWREIYGRIVLERPAPQGRGLRGLGARMAYWFAPTRMRLDKIGSAAWKRFDGQATVGEVCALLREELGEMVEPAEQRLGHFVLVLRKDGFVALKEET